MANSGLNQRLRQRSRRAGFMIGVSMALTIAVGVAKAGADVVMVSGGDGGTGAAPLSSMKHAGLPWELGLSEVHRSLSRNGLRGRVQLRVDGGLSTGRDVMVAAALGADGFAFGKLLLIAEGCIMARVCEKNTCPTGITTHDPRFQKGLVVEEKFARVANYAKGIVKEVETIAHSVGVAEPRQMRRKHVRIVQSDGRSIPLDVLEERYNPLAAS